MKPLAKVTFVVIGHNEEKHLVGCLQSILAVDYPERCKEIIYVDNSSSDRSLAVARSFPIKTIALRQQPSTPGLARNAGLHAASGEYVQFVDGDMKVERDWLSLALPQFKDEQVVAVVGKLKERRPEASLYNRLIDFGWQTAELGEISSPGGGGLFRTAAMRALGGYDDQIFGAEEIDLGYRLQRQNYKILRINCTMAWHDIDLTTCKQLWRRCVRDGYWEMEMIRRYFKWSLPLPQDYIWKMNAQLLSFVGLLIAFALQPHLLPGLLLVGLPTLFWAKKVLWFRRATGNHKMSLIAACFTYLNMLPIASGQIKYLWQHVWASTPARRVKTAMRQAATLPSQPGLRPRTAERIAANT